MQRYLSTVETSDLLLTVNVELVDFYGRNGIELLGDASIGKEFTRAGARWAAPSTPEASAAEKATYHHENHPIPFRAARALVNRKQTEIAAATGLPLKAVKILEQGARSQGHHETLRAYYEDAGAEFTGWGDAATGRFYGIGVRWKSLPPDSL